MDFPSEKVFEELAGLSQRQDLRTKQMWDGTHSIRAPVSVRSITLEE